MGDADDIRNAFKKVTADWTRQKKSEEREPRMRAYRGQRLTRAERGISIKDAAESVIEQAYMAASANGTISFTKFGLLWYCHQCETGGRENFEQPEEDSAHRADARFSRAWRRLGSLVRRWRRRASFASPAAHALIAEQRCAGFAAGRDGWQHRCQAAPRRIAPSIRSDLISGRDRVVVAQIV